MEKIKSCPFCGGKAELSQKTTRYKHQPTTIMNAYTVGCEKCRIYTPLFESDIAQLENGEVKIWKNGAEDAIKAWNMRVGDLK